MKISKRNKLFLTNSTNPCTILKKSSIEHTLTLRITNFLSKFKTFPSRRASKTGGDCISLDQNPILPLRLISIPLERIASDYSSSGRTN